MDLKLKNKIVLITGSSKGIGFSIAREFSEQGALVILNGRSRGRLIAAQKLIPNSVFFEGDITNEETCKKFYYFIRKEFNRLDILVCNIGDGKVPVYEKNTKKVWQTIFDNNFFATTNIIKATEKLLIKSKGNIVCISSICGIQALGCPISYSSAKAALESYVRNSSKHFAKYGVRINSIAPGNILFKGSTWDKKIHENKKEVLEMIKNKVPLGIFGSPENIAHATLFISSPLSAFTTGATLVVDGGQLV